MRRHSVSTSPSFALRSRLLALLLVMTGLGFCSTTASALEIVNFDIFDEGNERWSIAGVVDVDQETGEQAEITFGGALSGTGLTATTDYFGNFVAIFGVPYGSTITLTATTASETSEVEEFIIFDPANEP